MTSPRRCAATAHGSVGSRPRRQPRGPAGDEPAPALAEAGGEAARGEEKAADAVKLHEDAALWRACSDEAVRLRGRVSDQQAGMPGDAGVVEALADLWVNYTLLAEATVTDSMYGMLDFEPMVMRQAQQVMVFQLRDSVIQVDTFVTDVELRQRYEAEEPAVELRARHIMFQLPIGVTSAQRDSVAATLSGVRDRIVGGEDFEILAQQLSQYAVSISEVVAELLVEQGVSLSDVALPDLLVLAEWLITNDWISCGQTGWLSLLLLVALGWLSLPCCHSAPDIILCIRTRLMESFFECEGGPLFLHAMVMVTLLTMFPCRSITMRPPWVVATYTWVSSGVQAPQVTVTSAGNMVDQ